MLRNWLFSTVIACLALAHAAIAADRVPSRPFNVPYQGPTIAHKVPSLLKGMPRLTPLGTVNQVHYPVLNLRALRGGGRHLTRPGFALFWNDIPPECLYPHPCGFDLCCYISATFSEDLGGIRELDHALSLDEGGTWSVVGGLAYDDTLYTDRDLAHVAMGSDVLDRKSVV